MKTKTLRTRTGFEITVQNIYDTHNHIVINDCNCYPDNDSRSEERREWFIPINDVEELKTLAKNILKVCKNKK